MDIRFQQGPASAWRAQAVLTFAFEGEDVRKKSATLIDAAPWFDIAPAFQDFYGKKNEVIVLYGHPSAPVPRVVLVGLGKQESFNADILREAVASGVEQCRKYKIDNIAFDVERLASLNDDKERMVQEAVFAAFMPSYSYEEFRTTRKEAWFTPKTCALLFPLSCDSALCDAARLGEAAARGVCYTRDLVNSPANVVTPSYMEERAENLAKRYGYSVRVLNRNDIVDAGMGAFAAVAKGSDEEPRLIALEYCPKGQENTKPLVFVGKGVTFDSGGISLKPSANMKDMKDDMAAAGAVLGFFEAAGQLILSGKEDVLQRRIVGVMPCTENMPGGHATRPGDVVRAFNGKSVEIINTDAEGRLILADALAWAQKEYEPSVLVDMATLTGACLVALGNDVAAVFATDDALAQTVSDAGARTGEPYWHMPLWDRYFEPLKSDVADMQNSAGREGGTNVAAQFLKQFVNDDQRWAHLDIAGPAYRSSKNALCREGATGFAVRTLFELVLSKGLDA